MGGIDYIPGWEPKQEFSHFRQRKIPWRRVEARGVDSALFADQLATFCVLFGSASAAERRALTDGKVEASHPPPRAFTRSTAALMRRCRMVMAVCWSP